MSTDDSIFDDGATFVVDLINQTSSNTTEDLQTKFDLRKYDAILTTDDCRPSKDQLCHYVSTYFNSLKHSEFRDIITTFDGWDALSHTAKCFPNDLIMLFQDMYMNDLIIEKCVSSDDDFKAIYGAWRSNSLAKECR